MIFLPIVRMLFFALVFSFSATIAAQKKASKSTPQVPGNAILATVGSEPVTFAEVERAYQKNMMRHQTPFASIPRDSALDFLNLYTKYRLKVLSARQRGVDKDPVVIADMESNRQMLAESFFFDRMLVDSRVAELTNRRMAELRIGVILCAVNQQPDGSWDSLASYQKALDVIERLKKGEDFSKLATSQSDDKETGSKGGILPWITGGSIIKAVEDEAYSLTPGSYSQKPLHTRFGFFLVRLVDKKPRSLAKVRHILVTPSEVRDSNEVTARADSIINILRLPRERQAAELRKLGLTVEGDPFATLASHYSDDPGTGEKGGYLGSAYSRSGGLDANGARVVPEFEDAIFKLSDGEISGKVRTLYGLHIIRRDSTLRPDSLAEVDNARRVYKRLYYEEDKRRLIDSLRSALGYSWNETVRLRLLTTIDTTKNALDTIWPMLITPDLRDAIVYQGPRVKLTVGHLTDTMRTRTDMRGYTMNSAGLERAIQKITDHVVIRQASEDIHRKYPEFTALLQEFQDGILLFKVEEQEVWNKLKFDTTDARIFWENHRERLLTERMVNYTEVFVVTDSLARDVRSRADQGEDLSIIASLLTERANGRENRGAVLARAPRHGHIPKKIFDLNLNAGAIAGPFPTDNGFVVLRVDGYVEPRVKTFQEALPDLAPHYQDYQQKKFTEEWLSEVRKQFPVNVDSSMVDKIFRNKK